MTSGNLIDFNTTLENIRQRPNEIHNLSRDSVFVYVPSIGLCSKETISDLIKNKDYNTAADVLKSIWAKCITPQNKNQLITLARTLHRHVVPIIIDGGRERSGPLFQLMKELTNEMMLRPQFFTTSAHTEFTRKAYEYNLPFEEFVQRLQSAGGRGPVGLRVIVQDAPYSSSSSSSVVSSATTNAMFPSLVPRSAPNRTPPARRTMYRSTTLLDVLGKIHLLNAKIESMVTLGPYTRYDKRAMNIVNRSSMTFAPRSRKKNGIVKTTITVPVDEKKGMIQTHVVDQLWRQRRCLIFTFVGNYVPGTIQCTHNDLGDLEGCLFSQSFHPEQFVVSGNRKDVKMVPRLQVHHILWDISGGGPAENGSGTLIIEGPSNPAHLFFIGYQQDCKYLLKRKILQSAPEKEKLVQKRIDNFGGGNSSSEDLSLSHMTLSVKCPISLTPIDFPVIGEKCKHWSAFDLNNFMNTLPSVIQKPDKIWRCPICNEFTPPDSLVYDKYTASIIQELKTRGLDLDDHHEVMIDSNGHYEIPFPSSSSLSPSESSSTAMSATSISKRQKAKPVVVSLDSSEEEEEGEKENSPAEELDSSDDHDADFAMMMETRASTGVCDHQRERSTMDCDENEEDEEEEEIENSEFMEDDEPTSDSDAGNEDDEFASSEIYDDDDDE